MTPRATYRLQFHAGFTFADAAPLAPYFAKLAISHVYSSPIATARAGSPHGYDVVDPTRVNPELGGEEGFRALVAALHAEGLGVILDIVPNHMAVGGTENRWWLDVLEHGQTSAYADYFDIDWRPADPALHGKVLAPFLGAPYAEALRAGDLQLVRDEAGLAIMAHGIHRFPVRAEDRADVLAAGLESFDPSAAGGPERLHALLERQHYRLAWWRTAGDEINWRRFFDITELACLRMEREEVFDVVHALALRLYKEGLIDGLRIDHVDGLADPTGYCRTLRRRLDAAEAERPPGAPAGPAYLVVEKILAAEEALPVEWGTDGTSGYDAMNALAALLHAPDGASPLSALWEEVSGRDRRFEAEERQARREILTQHFAGQLDAVAAGFHALARGELATRDVTRAAIRRAIVTTLSVFPAYRSYGIGADAPQTDGPLLARARERAEAAAAPGADPAIALLFAWLSGAGPGPQNARRAAVRRFQQLSAPVAAKAVEDTAFYRYGRLLSRNDVGSDAERLASRIEDFHRWCAARAERWPRAMTATATHDHKRGEDVRARLAVLSVAPDAWAARARRWLAAAKGFAPDVAPDDIYCLLQSIVGAWPLDLDPANAAALSHFAERLARWQVKALREAKLRSSWVAPDEDYEAAAGRCLQRLLDPEHAEVSDIHAFVEEIAPAGALNGLVQAVLRCVIPGAPDLYQGCEFWDFSLVDPDNRRPVDYAPRREAIAEGTSPDVLLRDWRDGRVKQASIAAALRARTSAGVGPLHYEPIAVHGPRSANVLAFLCGDERQLTLFAAPIRLAPRDVCARSLRLTSESWGETRLHLPEQVELAHAVVGSSRPPRGPRPLLSDLFADFPILLATTRRT